MTRTTPPFCTRHMAITMSKIPATTRLANISAPRATSVYAGVRQHRLATAKTAEINSGMGKPRSSRNTPGRPPTCSDASTPFIQLTSTDSRLAPLPAGRSDVERRRKGLLTHMRHIRVERIRHHVNRILPRDGILVPPQPGFAQGMCRCDLLRHLSDKRLTVWSARRSDGSLAREDISTRERWARRPCHTPDRVDGHLVGQWAHAAT